MVRNGPGLLSVAHGPDQNVDLRRIADTAAIYAVTAMNVHERLEVVAG